jgi:hypothetical protein
MAPATHSPETLTADPAALVGRLDAATIRARIDQLDADRRALVVLLRAAMARERAAARLKGVADARQ